MRRQLTTSLVIATVVLLMVQGCTIRRNSSGRVEQEPASTRPAAVDSTATVSTAPIPPDAGRPGEQIARTEPMPHWLYLPREYGRKDAPRRWPLVLFLHGAGESGQDLEKVKKHGPPRLVSEGRQFPFILVSPQASSGWHPEELGRLLDRIEAQYAVDVSREYVTGLSMGGYGTWATLTAFPQRFAAAVEICGGGDPAQAPRIKHVPIWFFHGEKDQTVSIENSQKLVDAMKAAGGEVKFTTYPEAAHDSWTATYNNGEVYEWLLAHRRAPQANPR